MYSMSACIVNCRIKTLQSLCKCTPYYLPVPRSEGPVCLFHNLRCLNKYKEKLFYLYPYDATVTDGLELELHYSLNCPECLADCEHTQHYIQHSKIPLINSDFPKKEFKRSLSANIDMTNKILLLIYQISADGILNRLDVVSYWFEILSNIGGFIGILVGFSTVSVLEIIYFFVIRFSIRLFKFYFDK
ncbi:sodium channel protein Nach-like [Leptidea sinapis]|uniref:sodium channel protein Nach-like n=1 Tax=Leptidea sinapis TaxID=189913 RepID=UPI0021C33E1D|nr:sodium channel protein Nach-like [Leptidea sinapis]